MRIEFSERAGFIDAPTLFAQTVSHADRNASVRINKGGCEIETPRFRLVYTGDGARPDANNLSVTVKDSPLAWQPGVVNSENLGGTLQTLDGCAKALPLDDGLLSRNGWYLLDDSRTHILENDWIKPRPSDPTALDWYFFAYGTDYKAALQALAAVSGRVPLPRRHIFGSWYCRWWAYTSDDYRKIVREYSEHDFPLDIMVMDMDWHRKDGKTGFGWCNRNEMGWTGWSWNRELLPDIESLLKEFNDDNIYVTLNAHPHDGVRSTEDDYGAFMQELGESPAQGKDLPFLAGDRDYMEAYFKHAHQPHEEMGVDFWWVDWQQDSIMPYVYHIPFLRHLPWLNYLYFRHSEKGSKRGLGFSRWAGWGDHRYPIHFSGDAVANWEVLKFEIPFTVASGNSGCFFWAHDTGGFHAKDRDPELYARWVQFCTFSATLRLHSCGEHLDRRPWLWGEPYATCMREAFHLRATLIPYIYTSAWQCHAQTVPLLRAMFLEYPHEPDAYNHPGQYLFGDHLLVAPVVEPGEEATQAVWIPEGCWINWFTGEAVTGPVTIQVKTPLNRIPLWVRAGAVLPMQPYAERMTSAPLAKLQLRCTPVGDSAVESVLYEDDGQSSGYLAGESGLTRFRQKKTVQGYHIAIKATEGQYGGQLPQRDLEVQLHGYGEIAKAFWNGNPVAIELRGSVRIVRLTSCDIRQEQMIELMRT